MKKNIFIILVIAASIIMSLTVFAEDDLSEYGINDIQEYLDENNKDINISQMAGELMSGKSKNVFRELFSYYLKKDLKEVIFDKKMIVKIIMLTFVSSLLCNFTDMFRSRQLSDVTFYVIYLMITSLLFSGFYVTGSVAEEMVKSVCNFVKILIPSFAMAVGATGNISAATGTYEIMFASLYLISYLYLKILIKLVKVYVVLCLINNIFSEDLLSKTTELIRWVIKWVNRVLIGLVIGVNTVQSIIINTADTVRVNGVCKLITLFPGVGSSAKTVAEVLVGSGAVIKNTIGLVGMIVLIVVAFIPLAKMFSFSFMYKLTQAIIQPVADKRILKSIEGAYEGVSLLINIMFGTVIVFFISIVIICMSTNGGL